jgi:hypothetical protein
MILEDLSFASKDNLSPEGQIGKRNEVARHA